MSFIILHVLAFLILIILSINQSILQTLPELVREKLSALVRTEEQLLFVIHVTGPFLQRLHAERYMRPLFDLAVQYYRMLAKARTESLTTCYLSSDEPFYLRR